MRHVHIENKSAINTNDNFFTKIKYTMYNVQNHSILYSNAIRLVIRNG